MIREKAGYVFQDSENQLFMSKVYDDVAFELRQRRFSEKEIQMKTMQASDTVGIKALENCRIHELSGGEKKRAAIATVLPLIWSCC